MHLYRNIVFVKILVLFSYIFFSNVLCVHSIMATQRKVWAGGMKMKIHQSILDVNGLTLPLLRTSIQTRAKHG
jgi:hypothetical protein